MSGISEVCCLFSLDYLLVFAMTYLRTLFHCLFLFGFISEPLCFKRKMSLYTHLHNIGCFSKSCFSNSFYYFYLLESRRYVQQEDFLPVIQQRKLVEAFKMANYYQSAVSNLMIWTGHRLNSSPKAPKAISVPIVPSLQYSKTKPTVATSCSL